MTSKEQEAEPWPAAAVKQIFQKVRFGKHAEVDELLAMYGEKLGMEIDDKGNTLLHVAAQNGQKRLAKTFLRIGVSLLSRNHDGRTPAELAHHFNFKELGDYLGSKITALAGAEGAAATVSAASPPAVPKVLKSEKRVCLANKHCQTDVSGDAPQNLLTMSPDVGPELDASQLRLIGEWEEKLMRADESWSQKVKEAEKAREAAEQEASNAKKELSNLKQDIDAKIDAALEHSRARQEAVVSSAKDKVAAAKGEVDTLKGLLETAKQDVARYKKEAEEHKEKARLAAYDADKKVAGLTAKVQEASSNNSANVASAKGLALAMKVIRSLKSDLQDLRLQCGRDANAMGSVIRRMFEDFSAWVSLASPLAQRDYEDAHTTAANLPKYKNISQQVLQSYISQATVKLLALQKRNAFLHNQVQDFRGGIRVFCRIRPVGPSKQDADMCLHMKDTETVSTLRPGDAKERSFYFDRVFGAASSQADVFEPAAPFVTSVADGFNVCVFAYGPTGSGKTHTMVGMGGRGSDDRGFVFRAVESLYTVIKDRSLTHEYQVSMSIMEIYNETIRDLVEGDGSTGLSINSDANGGSGIQVVGLSESSVTGPEGAIALMEIAHRNRQVGSTQLNEHSSRSHLLQLFHVRSRVIASGVSTYSKMYLIDLAGSECAGKSGAIGSRLSEASAINKSLAALHDVVNALAQKASHVPYRNSKLTHVLQDSLGGRAKTLMYVMASPLADQSTESLGSLHFAERCKKVILGPAVKQGPDPHDTKAAAEAREAAKRARAEAELLKNSVASVQGEVTVLRGSLSNMDQLQARARELLNMPQPPNSKKKTMSVEDECALRASHMRDVLQKIEKMVQQQRDSEERHKIALAEAGRRTDLQKFKLKQGKDASLSVKSKLAAYRGSPSGTVPEPLELPMDISSSGYTIDAYPCQDDGGEAESGPPQSPAKDEYSRENSRDTSATVKLPRVAAQRVGAVSGSNAAFNMAASPYGQQLSIGGLRAPIQRKGGRGYDAGHARAVGGWK